MSRITVDMAEVFHAAARGRVTADSAGAVAAAVRAVHRPDTGAAPTDALLGRVLQEAAEGVRVMAVQVDEDATLLVAIAGRYRAAEVAAEARRCG